jgi:RND family efflux transporter MFP subunit
MKFAGFTHSIGRFHAKLLSFACAILLCAGALTAAFFVTISLVRSADSQQTFLQRTSAITSLVTPAYAIQTEEPSARLEDEDQFAVQAVLSPKRQAVISSGIDARITKFNVENGSRFKKGDILVEYDCAIDYGRMKEAQSRRRVTQKQYEAYEKLLNLKSASDMELLMARESDEQNLALIDQIQGRLKTCRHTAPFDGRVMKKMASQYEYAQQGRVLMDISSLEPLRAEFLVPSKWLRWMNVGTPLHINIGETGRTYSATIVAIHGEVDPVSQSIQVVAEMEAYHEELLPGMSGRAVFSPQVVKDNIKGGFLGLMLNPAGIEDHATETK